MKIEKLIRKPHYESILMLLALFDKDGKGLRQQHFRYALMDDPELPEKKKKYYKEFFGEYLVELQKNTKLRSNHSRGSPGILKGCVKSRPKLSNYLEELTNLKLIKRDGTHPDKRYHLTPKFREVARRANKIELRDDWLKRIKEWLNKKLLVSYYFRMNYLSNFHKIPHEYLDYLSSSMWILEGIPTDEEDPIFKSEELIECLKNIDENLFKIHNLLSPQKRKETIGFYYSGGITYKDLKDLK
jgi:hypothetical protein